MKIPYLTTSFSEKAKQAKSRFANILNTKAKKAGVLALAVILLFALVCGIIVGCVKNKPTNATKIVPGDTVVVTRYAQLVSADENTPYDLYEGDLLFVVYENDDTYHVQMPYMSHPAIFGDIEKSAVSKDAEKLAKANYASIKPLAAVYTNKGDVEKETYYSMQTPLRVIKRDGKWVEVSFAAGVDNKWVKSEDIEPVIPSTQVDFDYLDLQKRVDAGEEQWRLSPHEVVNDYLASRKVTAHMRIDANQMEETSANTMSYITEGYFVSVYQPIKKGEDGIWVVSNASLMKGQMDDAVPADVKAIVNSGMGWRINLKENKIIYTPYSSKQSWSVEDLAAQMGFDAKDYYGKDLDIMIYEYTAPKGNTAYLFVFDDEQLIGHAELDTKDKLELAKQTFIKWTEGDK